MLKRMPGEIIPGKALSEATKFIEEKKEREISEAINRLCDVYGLSVDFRRLLMSKVRGGVVTDLSNVLEVIDLIYVNLTAFEIDCDFDQYMKKNLDLLRINAGELKLKLALMHEADLMNEDLVNSLLMTSLLNPKSFYGNGEFMYIPTSEELYQMIMVLSETGTVGFYSIYFNYNTLKESEKRKLSSLTMLLNMKEYFKPYNLTEEIKQEILFNYNTFLLKQNHKFKNKLKRS